MNLTKLLHCNKKVIWWIYTVLVSWTKSCDFCIMWIFVGYCCSKDFLNHFASFGEDMYWEPDLLLQIGMNNPNVNLKFEQDLSSQIINGYEVSFSNIGICSLHLTHSHNAFWWDDWGFGFDGETFVFDTNYFFKSSAAIGKTMKLCNSLEILRLNM